MVPYCILAFTSDSQPHRFPLPATTQVQDDMQRLDDLDLDLLKPWFSIDQAFLNMFPYNWAHPVHNIVGKYVVCCSRFLTSKSKET